MLRVDIESHIGAQLANRAKQSHASDVCGVYPLVQMFVCQYGIAASLRNSPHSKENSQLEFKYFVNSLSLF